MEKRGFLQVRPEIITLLSPKEKTMTFYFLSELHHLPPSFRKVLKMLPMGLESTCGLFLS